MPQLKAKLSVVLMADDLVIAETEDSRLWQQVLNVINGDAHSIVKTANQDPESKATENQAGPMIMPTPTSVDSNDPVSKFAAYLGIDATFVQGACSPTTAEPFLHLDSHYWEAFKTQVTNLSGKSIPPISMAATLLLTWSKFAGSTTIMQGNAKKVLGTINLTDANPTRGLKKTQWISLRPGGVIILNPAEISKAQLASKCFCKKDWSEWNA